MASKMAAKIGVAGENGGIIGGVAKKNNGQASVTASARRACGAGVWAWAAAQH
jgi:hypothetical protein